MYTSIDLVLYDCGFENENAFQKELKRFLDGKTKKDPRVTMLMFLDTLDWGDPIISECERYLLLSPKVTTVTTGFKYYIRPVSNHKILPTSTITKFATLDEAKIAGQNLAKTLGMAIAIKSI